MEHDIETLKAELRSFLTLAKESQETAGRTPGARLLAVAITECEKGLGILGLIDTPGYELTP